MNTPHPIISIGGIAFNGCGMFLMPFLVGFVLSFFLDVSEVSETGTVMMILALIFILPPLVLQIVGVVIKVGRERLFLKETEQLTMANTLASMHRHFRIVTPRGWVALITGLWFIFLSLAFQWASLGLLAILTLLLFYSVLGLTSFLSTFQVRTFERGLGRSSSGIQREMSPAVVLSGEVAEERFQLTQVPVPAGFMLLIEDHNPPQLGTMSRYAVGARVRRQKVTLSGRFRKTPRGLHKIGPAQIWFQDALGFTRVSVASMATTELKVLPRFRNLEIVEPPRSRLQSPDVLTRPHRFATEDHFRFKEYAPGMDTRRIHWRLSIRTGHLQVRQPESREISTRQVLLALDSHLPPGRMLQDAVGYEVVLDKLVETWLSMAAELVERGDQVTIVTAADDGKGTIRAESLICREGGQRRWQDMGARVRWQGELDLPALIGELGDDLDAVVVSSRFFAPPPEPLGGQSFTWVYRKPLEALGGFEPPFWRTLNTLGVYDVGWAPSFLQPFLAMFLLPGPAGSDQNGLAFQAWKFWTALEAYQARQRLRFVAYREGQRTMDALTSRGESVYILEPGVSGHRLVGIVAGDHGRSL